MTNALDTAKAVLAKASLFDQTFARPDLGIAVAWAEALGDVNRADALTAVTNHYSQPSPRRIMPGDVLEAVRLIHAERVRTADSSMFEPPDVDPSDTRAYAAAKRQRIAAIANGETVPTEPPGCTTKPVAELLEAAVERLPKVPPAKPQTDLKKKLARRAS